ncbi:hypothetical protein KOW79_016080 [Hemibagrus wyckioides]|uniref:RRM domain-containing protein n=1 Tax=Hemibagrus wyckioides TaxID=337641 RepID=A0A9D3SDK6_9TELE|nr:hypothetical protein KOW79_016080 [Hemibagrus wyckioides]
MTPQETPCVVRGKSNKEVVDSKGYGYIQYESQEAEALAIKQLNGMLLNNRKLGAFPLKIHPTLAKKITLMLIEGENNLMIMDVIGDPECLRAWVDVMESLLKAREAGSKLETLKMLYGKKNKKRKKKREKKRKKKKKKKKKKRKH